MGRSHGRFTILWAFKELIKLKQATNSKLLRGNSQHYTARHLMMIDVKHFEIELKTHFIVILCTCNPAFYLEVQQLRPNIVLQKKEESSARNMNEAILNRLRPLRGSNSAATLMALTGAEALIPSRKDETQGAGSTTCGVNLRTLVRTPIFSDGNHIVLLTVPPGSSSGGASRSLFGGGGPMSSLRSLASNMCFNAKTGLFSARIDLVEAQTSLLGRGTALTALAACYDIINNLIWMSSGEYMDQFHNPSNLPPHHVHLRLGITETALPTGLGDNRLPVDLVVSCLLHNVSSMCLHQMTSSVTTALCGRVASSQDQQQSGPASATAASGADVATLPASSLDLVHLTRVTDILARAVSDKDTQAVICCLVVLEHIFRVSSPQAEQDYGAKQMRSTRELIWNLLTICPLGEDDETLLVSVKTESCHIITVGLQYLYPTQQERHMLLYQLLTSGDENSALVELRDMILREFSAQLSQQMPGSKEDEILQLSDDLVHYVLKLAVKESCCLLKSVQTSSREQFQTKMSNLPIASPAVQYLSALRSYYLKCAVLFDGSSAREDSASDSSQLTLQKIQDRVLRLSAKMIEGACEVLERYLETCSAVLGSLAGPSTSGFADPTSSVRGSLTSNLSLLGGPEELDTWLTGLEQLAKSTVLGSLLPVLVTTLTHPNLQCLDLAQVLMPSLVRLSLLASQAALLLKNQEMAASSSVIPSPDLDLGSASDVADLIGEAIDPEYSEEGDEGFLTGLKIPTPWASGKTVETIHPVRDNYKFKETIHIPGARCLYLRFDPRCSSQYDYDKVIVYAGPGIQGKKVCEYGGNNFGYGSRSVLGNGWPKDLVKVEGDTVTLTFEMRSGREHNTPDKAMWGFSCTIRAQESAEEVTPGLPFLSDLALGLSVLVCTQLAILYHGSPPSADELDCQHLLTSKILQRCAWPTEASIPGKLKRGKSQAMPASSQSTLPPSTSSPPPSKKTVGADQAQPGEAGVETSKLPRIRLSPAILDKLRKMAKRSQPVRLRPSIRTAIQPELVEESVVSAVLTHLGLGDLVLDLTSMAGKPGGEEELAALSVVVEEIYRRLEVLMRKLQVMAELEKRWEVEVEDHVIQLLESSSTTTTKDVAGPAVSNTGNTSGIESLDPPFFHDYHLQELRHKELALLAFLRDVSMDIDDMEATTKSLLMKFEASVLALKEKRSNKEKEGKGEGGLYKTSQVVSGILSRLELLLHVSSVPADVHAPMLPRTVSTCSTDLSADQQMMIRSDTDVRGNQQFSRSLSAPVGEMADPSNWKLNHQRWRHYKHRHTRGGGDKMRWNSAALLSDIVDGRDETDGDQDRPPHVVVIDQLFAFIGSDPEKAVSSHKFLSAAEERRKRGVSRQMALSHIKDLLAAASRVGGATHLIAAAAAVLRHGPKVEELLCGGMVEQVQEAFAQAMTSVVQLAAQNPMASASSIGLLCTIPYTRAEEKCLVRSGLVHLLDRLCSLGNHRADGLGTESQTPRQKVSALAWAGFQVLASRCVKWENEEGSHDEELEHSGLAKQVSMLLTHHLARATEGIGNAMAGTEALQEVLSLLNNLSRCVEHITVQCSEVRPCYLTCSSFSTTSPGSHDEELEHSGLAKQVSMLLTHHLARATEGIGNAMAGTEALQEVLSLLNNLSRSKMGKAILSQPACVSKLLSLLLDQRPSPKLVLIILQLCRVSLPLMNTVDCEEVELPAWGQQLYQSHWSSVQPVSDPPARIICLFLAKLGDFLVPGDQVLLSSRSPSQDLSGPGRLNKSGDPDKLDDLDVQRGKLSVFVHKRQDQLSHDIIQPLLNCDTRPLRLAGNANMEKVRALDREINKSGKVELTTEDAVSAFKKAFKWAQLGLVISTAPPTDSSPAESSNGTDKKKMASEVICKEKNSELARTDPVRAFISGHVANAMAAEVIALLHNLLSAQTSSTAHTWSQAVQRVLANALCGLPVLLNSLDGLSSPRSPRGTSTSSSGSGASGGSGSTAGTGSSSSNQTTNQLMSLAKLANAALCALGGFQETLKPGCEVKLANAALCALGGFQETLKPGCEVKVLANALFGLPVLLNSLDGLSSPRSPRGTSTSSSGSGASGGSGSTAGTGSSSNQTTNQLMSLAKLANAALCALGGFQETLKPGCEVKVTGEGVRGTRGTVLSLSEQNDVATVQLSFSSGADDNAACGGLGSHSDEPTYSDTIKVPLARVQPVRNETFCKHQPEMTKAFLAAAKVVILPPDEPVSPLVQTLHCSGDGNSMANQVCRVVAEIRTRTSIVLSRCLQDIQFTKDFIEECGYSIDMLKSLAKDCDTGNRLPLLEAHCHRLRMLYRDCAKPPPPPCRTDSRPSKEMVWDVQRPFPPTRACLFSHGLTAVMFLGDPSAGVGLPRGTMVYANQPIPKEAPSFYWEVEVASFGDVQDESGAVVSFGFAPPVEKKDGAWTNPVGTCLFLNNGKAVHYNGSSLLQWRSVRLEVNVGAGDVAGIGWERSGDVTNSGVTPKGQVYFTYNGQRLNAFLDSVSGALYPVVHIQKKGCRVKANFGARPFAYAEGQQHRDAAEEANDVLRDIRESFNHLPFHGLLGAGGSEDSESDSADASHVQAQTSVAIPGLSDPRENKSTPPKVPCIIPQPQPSHKEYSIEASQNYKLLPSFDNFVLTGPDTMFSRPSEEDSDDEAASSAGDESQQLEDHYALLVKAWEQKVFPVIRRRFRNEAERKDGLEQIRGALQLGMTDIARQTVEFLYEENGGIPRDLHLPTIDDIKEDLAKFTIDRVKKGTTVNIRTPTGMAGGTTAAAAAAASGGATAPSAASTSNATMQLPKFAVRSMLKTFGLTGTVLDVDTANELVQVETYLRSEGVLVRFWYPLIMLEKPGQGMRKASITGGQTMDTSNIYIHRELLSVESALAHMHLRTAFLRLTDHCNSPAMEVTSCSASLGSGMAACAATLQELDLENIHLLSEHLLSSPATTGTLEASSPFHTSNLSQLSLTPQVSLPSLVYRNSLRLKRQLATAIARASNQGEDYLIELTNQLCTCLQTAPEMFPYLTFPVNETKVSTDIHFSGAACILVSCIKANDTSGKETPPYRAPWARISTYTGKRIRKSGHVTRQEVVCYPRDMHGQAAHCDQFAPVIIPSNHVYVKIGVSPPPGVTVTLHALPPQFLLSVAYMETLVTETFGCGTLACGVGGLKSDKACGATGTSARGANTSAGREGSDASEISVSSHSSSSSYSPRSSSTSPCSAPSPMALSGDLPESSPSLWSLDNISVTPLVFLHVVEFLCSYLWKTDVACLVKEYLFHLLAQTLRVLHYSEGCPSVGAGSTRLSSKLSSRPSPTQGILVALPKELKKLYDMEGKNMPEMTTPAGHGMGLGVTDSGRWSTYLQALLEVCLAISEVVPCEALQPKDALADAAVEEGAAGTSATATKGGSGLSSSGKKKKLKPKKERMAASARRSSLEQRASLWVEADETVDPTSLMHSSHSLADAHNAAAGGVGLGMAGWEGFPAKATSSNTSICSLTSAVSSSSFIKIDDMPWFPAAVSTSKILRHMALREAHCEEEVRKAIKFAASSVATPTAHTRIVIVTGIPTYLEQSVVQKSVRKVCNSQGGMDSNRLFVPTPADIHALDRQEKKKPAGDETGAAVPLSLSDAVSADSTLPSGTASKSETSVSQTITEPSATATLSNPSPTVDATTSKVPKSSQRMQGMSRKLIEGYAVFSLPSKTKVEVVRKAFLRTKWLNLGEDVAATSAQGRDDDDDDGPAGSSLMEAPEENLNVHTVNQQLLTEPEAMVALEKFLLSKLYLDSNISSEDSQTGTNKQGNLSKDGGSLSPVKDVKSLSSGLRPTKNFGSDMNGLNEAASQALTEIFYTCYFMDQGQQDSGDICLGREQILNPAAENLLGTFFNAVRPAKKSLPEAVSAALRQYGIVKSRDKDVWPSCAEKSSKVKAGKRPVSKSSKERMSLKDQEEKGQSVDKENKKDMDKEAREKPEKPAKEKEGATADFTVKESKSFSKSEGRSLTLNAFIKYCEDLTLQDLRAFWRGLFACGFDLLFERCWCADQTAAVQMMSEWTVERDYALVQHINEVCCSLAISSSRMHPHEVRLSEAQLAHEAFTSLQGIPVEMTRLRMAFLQQLNNFLETSFLPLVDMRPARLYSRSTAFVLAQVRWVVFYDTKVNFLNRVLNASAKRKPHQAAPEITLNPLESIGTGEKSIQASILCQAYRQLSTLSSRKLCVRLACGGDPTYSFNVRMTGEEVHGTSGSFRHFLWQVARELQSSGLSLLMTCPGSGTSSGAGNMKGRLILKTGKMTYPEENLLIFIGQLLGITIRAGIPLGLDLLSTVWKLLVGMTLDPCLDLQEADAVTYKYIKRIEMAESEEELESVLGEPSPRFMYTTLNGIDAELVPGGRSTPVCWSNRHAYIDAIKRLRMRELASPHRLAAITTGVASLLPCQILTLLTPEDMEVRTSGRPHISLDFLKSHTMYQVGLVESDAHIEYFWLALDSFSQEELARFIKFACNQERIPQTCPCQEGGPDSAHVPPYPMKIAPPDGAGPPDARHIRVETCMFMIKLPQYSSLEVMASRLRYAINCREDPLSG
ncbi:HECT domain-containing e3 ubiquitin protein ligase 4 [Plakobranchus ocellatus]|uniref:HECT domain-containing e3 ubiquitin protein ligase 4 n=1 Tax=Plakobranchus ocellatus TaxID=259542 RepID=A0AAV4A388_9GAST|nr:HECT domain-containing e3 ubiquitin protein ligase 4 [Plakobranchus ocellatus]